MTNQNQLILRKTANQQLPSDGPKFVKLPFDFSTQSAQAVDLIQYVERKFITSIQTAFIDNSTNPSPLTLAFGQPAGQSITVPPLSQGYYSILVPETYMTISTAGAVAVIVIFINVPIAPSMWYPAGNNNFKFDGSGNLETADQNLAPAIVNGVVQTSGSGGGGGGGAGVAPNIFAWNQLQFGTTDFENILAAPTADPYYLRSLDVSLSGDATLPTAGLYTVSIFSTTSTGTITGGKLLFKKSIYVPAAVPAVIPPNYQIFKFEDLELADKVNAGAVYFAVLASGGLNTGHLDIIAGGGLVSAG